MGKGKMGKGSAGAFSEAQVEMYRECFKLMDIDKDGVINKNDLRAAFDNVGKQKIRKIIQKSEIRPNYGFGALLRPLYR